MPKATTRSPKKIKNIMVSEIGREHKKINNGLGARELKRANDPTLGEKRVAAQAREQARLFRVKELEQKADRVKAAEAKAAAARLATERLKRAGLPDLPSAV